jgi:hypothetical protein
MCGIAGLVHLDGSPVSPVVLKGMTDAIAHRGPDGEGHWVENNVGLGHRRLAIIDLSPLGPSADDQRGPALCRDLQRRDLQLPRTARSNWKHGRLPVPQHQRQRGGALRLGALGVRRATEASTACFPWPCGTVTSKRCCSPATVTASSRCTTHGRAIPSPSAPSRRPLPPGRISGACSTSLRSLEYFTFQNLFHRPARCYRTSTCYLQATVPYSRGGMGISKRTNTGTTVFVNQTVRPASRNILRNWTGFFARLSSGS